MSSTIEKLSTTRAKLTITVAFDEVKPAITQAYRTIAGQISLPGFRKGHVPPSLIDQRVGRGAVLSEALNAILPDLYAKAVEDHHLTPLGQPEVDVTKLEDGQEVEFTAVLDVRPDFDVPDGSTLAVTVAPLESPDKGVDERVTMLRERFVETKTVDRAAAAGDQVTIDLTAAVDGRILDDASAHGVPYVVGSGGVLDGLDEAVTGLTAGESATFASTLVGGGHEGETADVTVVVIRVEDRILPEVDDAFAQLVSQFDTVAEMRADLAQSVVRQGVAAQLNEARDKVLDAAIAATPFDLPEDLVAREVTSRIEQITGQLKGSGLTLAQYVERVGAPGESTEAEFRANLEKSVERGTRAEILLGRVAEQTTYEVSEDDLTNLIFQKAMEAGTTPEQELNHMREHGHLNEWLGQIRQSKALDSLVLKAKVTDTAGKKVDLAAVLTPAPAPAPTIVLPK